MDHPYTNLKADKFWRSAITEKGLFDLYSDIWDSKFPITKQTNILATGSCFAQHVGKWLLKNGYNYLPSSLEQSHGFSFATGNIYTPALLLQWLEIAFNEKDLSDIYAKDNNVFYDILRPAFKPDGFQSLGDLLHSRQEAIDEISNFIKSGEIFIFTLGLTEAWVNKKSDVVYPICPGTICGEFSPTQHSFKNYSTQEIKDDLLKIFNLIKSQNENINFLLTVSPVPLTATASSNHILPATIYSKSVLRAIAGEVSKERTDVDYFPSYEIIASHPSKAAFFEENLRSVKSEGVSYVMAHLENGLKQKFAKNNKKKKIRFKKNKPSNTKQKQGHDIVCEDLFLESLNSFYEYSSPPKYWLIGDSHMGKLSKAFKKSNTPHLGGMVMNGSRWFAGLFHIDKDEMFVPLESKESRTVWRNTLSELTNHASSDKPTIITNIGLQTHKSVPAMTEWYQETYGTVPITVENLLLFFKTKLHKHIELLDTVKNNGYNVIVLSDPPVQKYFSDLIEDEPLYSLYEKVFGQFVNGLGIKFIDTRDWVENELGGGHHLKSEFLNDGKTDLIHGSEHYYDELAKKIFLTLN